MRSVNLIPAARRQARRRRKTVRHWAVGCVVYLAAMGATYLFCADTFGAGSLPVESELVRTGRNVDQSARKIAMLESKLDALRMKLAANESVGNQPDWGLMLSMIARKTGPFVVLRNCRLEPIGEIDEQGREQKIDIASISPQRAGGIEGGYRLVLEGVGKDQTAVWEFILALEKTELFQEVRLVNSQMEIFNAERAVGFHLICLLTGEDE
jgi:hypothetical protein